MNLDVLKNKYALSAVILLAAVGIGLVASDRQPVQPLEETLNTDLPQQAQNQLGSQFSVPDLFSFGSDAQVNPSDRVTYSTGIELYEKSDFCISNPFYSGRYAVWLQGEGTGQDYEAFNSHGDIVTLSCDGSSSQVEITMEAPETVGEYEYKLMAASYSKLTQMPMYNSKYNFADISDTLEVKEPVEQPTSTISLSTHSAEKGSTVSVATQSDGDITEETLTASVNGETKYTVDNFHSKGSTNIELDEAGEWRFELKTEYQGDTYYSDTDSAGVTVEGFEDAEAVIQTASNAEKGDTITLDGSRSSGEGDLSYTWYVNDEEIAYSSTTEYQIQTIDTTLAVQLEIEDQEGQKDAATTTIQVGDGNNEDSDNDNGGSDGTDDGDGGNSGVVYIATADAEECNSVFAEEAPTEVPTYSSYDGCMDANGFGDGEDDSQGFFAELIDFLIFWN